MLVSAMIIIPPVAALQLAGTFKKALILACAFSITSVLLGIYFAFLLDLPSGAAIILFNLLILTVCTMVKKYAAKKRTPSKAD
jgi:ABC-type Mn2+/Zn2+ transport system permease subunit